MVLANRLVFNTLANRAMLVFLVLQLADIFTTAVGLSVGATELNPLPASVFSWLGPAAGLPLVKLLSAGTIVAILVRIQSRFPDKQFHWSVVRAANVAYSFVVFQNFTVILSLVGVVA
jgi:hypothetical protein